MDSIDILEYGISDIAQGFTHKENRWVCLLCGEEFEDGVIYEFDGRFFEAFRAVPEHIKSAHGFVFRHLLHTQQKYTGLTEHQSTVLGLMADGLGDKAIALELTGTENTASIRNLRFQLKERERQAKAYLALMEAFRLERAEKVYEDKPAAPQLHTGAELADGRFEITETERAAVLKTYFTTDGALKEFPVREKRKIVVLSQITARFEPGRTYTEKEVNAIIAYNDFATIRRYLIEYGFLERTQDGRQYWVKEK